MKIGSFCYHLFKNQKIMSSNPYDIDLQEDKQATSPASPANQQQPASYNPYYNQEEQHAIEDTENSSDKDNKMQGGSSQPSQAPKGCTKFCKIEFYEQFFQVSQEDVVGRIKLSFIPINKTFVENLNENPDLYGPFWLMTTIIFLLSSTGNLSRYFYNFEQKDQYLFRLQLVRFGVLVVYSFGFGFPTILYFVMKFFGCTRLTLPEVICTYGYSFSCFIPIFLLCIIPAPALQWILIAYGMINTTIFLVFNLKAYLEDIEPPKMYVVFGLIAGAQIALFLTFKLVFFDLVFENDQ